MTDFIRDYHKAKQSIPNKEIKYTQSFILDTLCPYIKQIQMQNPDADVDELYEILKQKSCEFAETAFTSTYAFDFYMQYISCKHFQSNPKLFNDIYQKLQSGELTVDPVKQNIHTNNSFYDYLVQYVHSADETFQDIYKLGEKIVKNNPFLMDLYERKDLTNEEKCKKAENYIKTNISSFRAKNGKPLTIIQQKDFAQSVNYYLGKEIKGLLPKDETFLEQKLKNILATSISAITSQLIALNLYDKYKGIELTNFKKMHFEEFITNNKQIDITNPEILKNLPVTDLMILNSFWMNRYAKELESYANGMFTITSLDLLPDIMDGTLDIGDINKDVITASLTKCRFLKPHIQRFIYEQQEKYYTGKLREDKYTVHEGKHFITYSFKPVIADLKSSYQFLEGAYQNIFKEDLPYIYNDVGSDAILYGDLISPVVNIYDMKTETIHALLSTLPQNRDIVNAGLIPDSVSEDGSKIYLDPNFVCIGIDTKLTFPVREHLKLSALKEFLVSLQNDQNYVPLYVGDEDFRFPNGEIVSAQQILPFSEKQEKFLKKYIRELQRGTITQDSNYTAFIEHLNWLRDPSAIPDKYLSDNPNGKVTKKGTKGKTFTPKYINISEYKPGLPLQVYMLSQDGNYIPIGLNRNSIAEDSKHLHSSHKIVNTQLKKDTSTLGMLKSEAR